MMTYFAWSLLLTFTYQIVHAMLAYQPLRKLRPYTVYLWGIAILLISSLPQFHSIYSWPDNLSPIVPPLLLIIVCNVVVARYSGYAPQGRFNKINFVVAFPVIEEILFRGLILHLLNVISGWSEECGTILYMPVTVSVLVSSVLFAVCHLQYYKLSAQSMRFMLFAFTGGILFGGLAHHSGSILPGVFLHMLFNGASAYYSRRTQSYSS